MKWNRMEWKSNGMEWNGNQMEWNGNEIIEINIPKWIYLWKNYPFMSKL